MKDFFSYMTKLVDLFGHRITNDENEDVAEQNLQEVDSVIGTLKDIAKDQGRTLSKSNIQIDSLNNKVRIILRNFI